jgi:hypothetical protein
MSLKPTAIEPVPAATVQVARAAFPRGNVYLILRDALGTIFGYNEMDPPLSPMASMSQNGCGILGNH